MGRFDRKIKRRNKTLGPIGIQLLRGWAIKNHNKSIAKAAAKATAQELRKLARGLTEPEVLVKPSVEVVGWEDLREIKIENADKGPEV